jgi:hypothetical protein
MYELVVPRGYNQRMRKHYRKKDLQSLAQKFGLVTQEMHYVLGSELIVAFRKPKLEENLCSVSGEC